MIVTQSFSSTLKKTKHHFTMKTMCGTEEQALAIKSSKPSSVENGIKQCNGHETIVNLDHGDPTMYESYWEKIDQERKSSFPMHQSLSYFANKNNMCWFLEPKLEEAIKTVHNVVGNAVVEDRYIVVGTGSSQLILAAFFALADQLNDPNPVNVVSAVPYYSSYPEMTDHLRSGLFKWNGDARSYDKDEPCIEVVTSPNNPDGFIREPLVNKAKGMVVHDLAYYWPQYTAITSPADHDIMLFTLSKSTGHAGSRIGWAIVKDKDVAKKMIKFIEINTIGVSKEAQLRASDVLEIISLSCQRNKPKELENFFEYSQNLLSARWNILRDTIKNSQLFNVPKYPLQYCNFFGEFTEAYPAFAWMKCKDGVDCSKLLKEKKIMTRNGKRFGTEEEYARISMVSKDEEFDLFVQRLSTFDGTANGN